MVCPLFVIPSLTARTGGGVRSAPSASVPAMDLLKLADRSWPVLGRLMDGHTYLYRATQRAHRAPDPRPAADAAARPRRRQERHEAHRPLLYISDGDDVVIVASKGGYPKHPAWFHNLRANPDTTVQIGSERRPVHARVATPEERKRLWPRVVSAYRDYARYQERTGARSHS